MDAVDELGFLGAFYVYSDGLQVKHNSIIILPTKQVNIYFNLIKCT